MAKKKQVGYDCSCCDFARKLPNKDLENDFVYCCNPDCEFHYHVLFEHFKCKKDEEDEEGEQEEKENEEEREKEEKNGR